MTTVPTALDHTVIDELRRIVGDEHVLTTDGDVEPFARDATPLFRARPDAVVLPSDTAQVSAVLTLATRYGIPVTPRGAGSNLAAATIAEHGGIVLVLTRMNKVLEVNSSPGFEGLEHATGIDIAGAIIDRALAVARAQHDGAGRRPEL